VLNICCHESCNDCSGPGANACLSCNAPRIFDGTYCCHQSCDGCTGPDNTDCTACAAGLALRPSGQCCHPSCLTCDGVGIENC
jgi:proprotein convertase subtilisin/kexin type 5